MNFLTLLASDPVIPFLGRTYDISLNWLGQLIRILIEGIGIVGVGIIVFSIILRMIVLPFDIYQRVTMRKQNIKMKENKEKMEKLQKQYANDKAMYNQKLMEMYKENGISMFCPSSYSSSLSARSTPFLNTRTFRTITRWRIPITPISTPIARS